MRYSFAGFLLDDHTGGLLRGTEEVPVRPKVIALLVHLIHHRSRIVDRQELIRWLWPDVIVGESSLSTLLGEARSALGDTGAGQCCIETIPRRGYRFVAKVTVRPHAAGRGARQTARRTGMRHPDLFVGRERELALAEAALRDLLAGRARHLVISGAMGIGKSRLVREIASMAIGRGIAVHRGRCDANSEEPPLRALCEVLRSVLEARGDASNADPPDRDAQEISALVADEHANDRSAAQRGSLIGRQARFHVFDCARRLVARIAEQDPVLVIVEDLQHASTALLDGLRHLACGWTGGPVMLLASHCDLPLPQEPARAAKLAELVGEASFEKLALGPLSRAETRELVWLSSPAGQATPAGRTIAFLYRSSGGNPLFVKDLVQSSDALCVAGRNGGHGLPHPSPSLRTRIDGLLAGLSRPSLSLLRTAAAIGTEFSLVLLGAARDLRGMQLLEAMEPLVRADLLRPCVPEEHRYAFSLPVVRHAVLASLGPFARATLHLRVGEAIERHHHAELEPHLASLIHQFRLAIPADSECRAVAYATRAAELAAARRDHGGAARLYQIALDALETTGADRPRHRGLLLIELSRAQARMGSREASNASLLRAARIAGAPATRDLPQRRVTGDPSGVALPARVEEEDMRAASLYDSVSPPRR